MLAFVVRRILIAIPLLLASSFLVFVMVANAGVPRPVEDARLNPRVSEAQRRAMELRFDLDEPVLVRYGHWLGNVVKGDLGQNNAGQDVFPQIRHAMAITLRLVVSVVVLAVLIALVIGVVSALWQYSIFDYSSTFAAFLFFSLPVFWLGVLLKLYGGIRLNEWTNSRFFYTIGYESARLPAGFFDRLVDYAGHTILPVFTLILISVAQYSRYTRSSMLDVMSADYVRTAHAKGLPRGRVIVRHALRNALIPVTTIVAIDIGALFSGAIITERVFQWRAMGTLFIEGLQEYDVYVVAGWLLVTAAIIILFNLVADIIYAVLDPRIRL